MNRRRTKLPICQGRLKHLFLIALIFCLASVGAFAQDRLVSGQVTDKDGPLIGVNIVIKGETIGTITDFEGNYALKVGQGDAVTLQYKFIGYKTQEIIVGNQSQINVRLVAEVTELDELVVVGYGTMKKSDLTGAVEVIDTENLTKFPVSNVSSALEGRVSGVFVSSTAEPGASPNINIRGVGTINGNSTPLYVVDGVQLSDISGINPSDIESMQVLKDASSAAIYGSRAANGVIIVTTKSGKSGESKFTFNVETGVSAVASRLDMMDTRTYAQYTSEMVVNASTPLSPLTPPAWVNDESLMGINTDWQDLVFEMGKVTKADLALSGGSDHGSYRVSLGYITQEGTIADTGYDRLNLGVSTRQTKGILTLGLNSTLFFSNKQKNPITDKSMNIYQAAPQIQPYDPDNLNGLGKPTFDISGNNNFPNPLVGELWDQYRRTYGAIANLFSEIAITEPLKFRTDVNLNYQLDDRNFYNPKVDQGLAANLNPSQNGLNIRNNQQMNILIENYLKFNKEFGQHTVNGMVGNSVMSEQLIGMQINAVDLEEGTRVPQTGDIRTSYGSNQVYRQVSFLGRVNYNYDNRYLFTGSYRMDGSSRFKRDRRWSGFPSFSAGWKISEEKFMEDVNVFSNLKLRAGYGELGRQIGNAVAGLNSQIKYPFPTGDISGTAPLQIANDDLGWETVQQTNIGLDMGLFDDALTFTAEYFIRNSTDMLLKVNPGGYTGVRGQSWVNTGKLVNNGVELNLSYKAFNDNGWEHVISLNSTMIQNEIKDLPTTIGENGLANDASLLRTGEPIGAFYGYRREGINEITGKQMFRDLDGNGEVNADDREVLGSPHPTYFVGLNYSLRYNNFDFSIFVQGVGGHQLYNKTRLALENGAGYGNRLSYVLEQSWHPDRNPDSEFPIVSLNDNSAHKGISNSAVSDRWIEDADYIRLKNVQIGYTLPQALLDRWKLNSVRVFISGIDLFTITKYTGLDPSNISNPNGSFTIGYDGGTYPAVRSMTAGLQMAF
ncbi:TonB-dependent receptor [Persicobacter diffluens]|uniref:SusC/RagA family TonB-linked outer membrane protein n=1 Tax=Persicobacter diffluens TaxID=981 RepID=A0AAN5APG9_9BACT|nr:SusC/RagA family TonB-linked outer membrane protein [Persicobacter diffluens]